MGLFDFIAVLGLIQAAVVATLIFTNKVFKNSANKYFAYFLLLLAVIGLDSRFSTYYGNLNDFWEHFLDIVGDDIPWIMICYLPLFKFFMEISGTTRLKVSFRLLFIPFFTFVIINGIIDLDLEFGLINGSFFTTNRILFYQMEDYISILMFAILHGLAFYALIRKTDNKWIKRLWGYCTVLIFIWFILIIDQTFFDDLFLRNIEIVLWSAVAVFVYWLMYSGLFQFNLANNRQEIRHKLDAYSHGRTSQKTKLSVKSKTYFDQLMEFMHTDKAYRDPELGRETIAAHLGISASYLTQLVKEHANQNLASFINKFRVEEVKQMLNDPSFDAYDQLSIGLEAGFKSKSAYYTTFKHYTGMTPAQFKQH